MPGEAETNIKLDLEIIPETLAVSRLDSRVAIPDWAVKDGFFSITRTAAELSIVCEQASVPAGVRAERGWRALAVKGRLDFALTGVLASLAGPLAEAGVSIFAISTFDTDYVLVREGDLEKAVAALRKAGQSVAGR